MRLLPALLLASAFSAPLAAAAAPADDLANCLKDNTTGKDRKDLARWVFLSISVHPDMRPDSNATEATRTAANKNMAELVTRLLTERCATETRAVAGANAREAMRNAFRLLGEVAVMELTTNQDVAKSIEGFTQYLDIKKFEAVLQK